ncbi:MAG: hypothetical protein IPN26_14280 [Bacteroidetes bacterium]|nr:hypothetical protein [Bacteroidota bacterium]
MKKILLSLVVMAATLTSFAQMPFVLSGTNYTQSFDNLGSGLPMGWRVDTLVNKNAGLGNDAQVRYSSTTVTWSSTSRGFKNVASADGLTSLLVVLIKTIVRIGLWRYVRWVLMPVGMIWIVWFHSISE